MCVCVCVCVYVWVNKAVSRYTQSILAMHTNLHLVHVIVLKCVGLRKVPQLRGLQEFVQMPDVCKAAAGFSQFLAARKIHVM